MAIPRLLRPSVLLRRNALYKGLFGGSRGWLAVGAVIWGRKFVKRTFGRNEEIIATEKLTKGQFLRIDAIRPPSRRELRASRRVR
ncbi:MAG: hypothetical protein AAB131_03415 [Actinomycetota bacterium]|mgnify:FL=1|jgi:hypothetical protein|nr:MAG: hypothetical protein FD127_1682 [Acidimicrobiaceae bacterium]